MVPSMGMDQIQIISLIGKIEQKGNFPRLIDSKFTSKISA
jgi:hypothetical protein